MPDSPQETLNHTQSDRPTPEQMDWLEQSIKTLLDPAGENPQIDGYVSSTFNYILEMFDKVAKADNEDAAAEEIANDLKRRYDEWAETQKTTQIASPEE